MDERSRQLRVGLVMLVAGWIGGYWLWQPRVDRPPGISFDQSPPRERPGEKPSSAESTNPIEVVPSPEVEIDTPARATPAPMPIHTVGPNETLSDIANAHYGRSSLWEWIYHNNRDVITNPDRLKLGMKLRLVPLGEDGG